MPILTIFFIKLIAHMQSPHCKEHIIEDCLNKSKFKLQVILLEVIAMRGDMLMYFVTVFIFRLKFMNLEHFLDKAFFCPFFAEQFFFFQGDVYSAGLGLRFIDILHSSVRLVLKVTGSNHRIVSIAR